MLFVWPNADWIAIAATATTLTIIQSFMLA